MQNLEAQDTGATGQPEEPPMRERSRGDWPGTELSPADEQRINQDVARWEKANSQPSVARRALNSLGRLVGRGRGASEGHDQDHDKAA